MEFRFVSKKLEEDEQLWDFWLQLGSAGLYVDHAHQGTHWEDRVNAWGGHGFRFVPAVKTTVGVTINWYRTKPEGRLRLDGKESFVDALRPRLRRAFEELVPANRAGLQQGRMTQEDVQRRARMTRIAGKVLVLRGATLFRSAAAERQGAAAGVWDVLDEQVGARNVPARTTMPWPVVLRTGATVSIFSDGRVRVVVGRATVQAVEDVERLLQTHFGARWVEEETHVAAKRAMEVVYGEPGPRALSLQRPPVFR